MDPKCNYMYCHKREAKGNQTHREDNRQMEAETGVMWAQAKERHLGLKRQGGASSIEPPEEAQPCPQLGYYPLILIFDFSLWNCERRNFSFFFFSPFFKLLNLCSSITGATEN